MSRGRTDSILSRRLILSRLGGDERATRTLVKKISPRYKERSGGYVRVIKARKRKGDASPMARIEFV